MRLNRPGVSGGTPATIRAYAMTVGLVQALEARHPAGVPHQHLEILAVRPGRQGRGIGTALLTARHRDLDRDAAPAYLEASSPRARDLCLRHGYTLQPGAAFRLPEGPLLWPMWREPRARPEDTEGSREP